MPGSMSYEREERLTGPGAETFGSGAGKAESAALRIEQRQSPRYTLLLRQAKLRTMQGEFLCVIRDLSRTGISVRTFHPLPPGTRMAIELREGCPYLVEKVWEREGEAGFCFREPVAISEMLRPDTEHPRRPLRVAIELPAVLASGGERSQAMLHNLSQQGARLDSDRLWAQDQLLQLSIAGLPVIHAKVRWRRGMTHGLVFENCFAFRDFVIALAKFRGLA